MPQSRSNSSSDSDDNDCITNVDKGIAIAARTKSSTGLNSSIPSISTAPFCRCCTENYGNKTLPTSAPGARMRGCHGFDPTPAASLNSMGEKAGSCTSINSCWFSSNLILQPFTRAGLPYERFIGLHPIYPSPEARGACCGTTPSTPGIGCSRVDGSDVIRRCAEHRSGDGGDRAAPPAADGPVAAAP